MVYQRGFTAVIKVGALVIAPDSDSSCCSFIPRLEREQRPDGETGCLCGFEVDYQFCKRLYREVDGSRL
jgi:hypothetical protein